MVYGSFAVLAMVLAQTGGAGAGGARSHIKGVQVGVFPQEVCTVYTAKEGLPDNATHSIVTAGGKVYAVTAKGLASLEGGVWQRVPNVPSGAARFVARVERATYAVIESALYRFGPGEILREYDGVPANATCVAAGGGAVWIGTATGLLRVSGGTSSSEAGFAEIAKSGPAVRQVAVASDGRVAVAAQAGLFLRLPEGRWERLLPYTSRYGWSVQDARGVTFDRKGRLWFCCLQGVGCLEADAWKLCTGLEGLPYNDFTTAASGEAGAVWFGTKLGAIRFDGVKWGYRQGRRWLPDDQVNAIDVDEKGNAWFATPGGVGLIERRPMTLAEKARLFEDRIDKRHRRTPYGFVNESGLKAPGDLSEASLWDSDNDGLWTGMYGAGECFAYGATKDPLAKKRATAAFEALKFLCDVTQGGEKKVQLGFPARSILPTDGHNPNADHKPENDMERRKGDPQWKVLWPRWPRSADGKWFWKCDTSSDELDGHYFLNSLYYDLVAETPEEKARARKVICDTTDHLMNNDFGLVDWDGKRTRWAYFGPNDLNHNPVNWEERGMNSLGILSFLTIAHHVSGDAKYLQAKEELIRKHCYAMNAYVSTKVHDGAGTGNQSDDEMTYMRFYTILQYETDPKIRAMMEWGLWRYWIHVRRSKSPFFNFLYAGTYNPNTRGPNHEDYTPFGAWLQESVDMLTGQSLDTVNWSLRNSHRLDILTHHEWPLNGDGTPTKGYMRDGGVLPIENRYIQHWSEDNWRLDQGGDGRTESDGAYWLMGYYAGKYFGYIKD